MRLILLLALLLAPVAAHAGQRATFTGRDGRNMIVEVGDNGDARIGEANAADHVLLVGGEAYVIGNEAGKLRVARLTDIVAVIDSVVSPIFGDLFTRPMTGPQPLSAFRIVPEETRRTVGGREGRVHQVYGLDDEHPDKPVTFVISDDPKLAPVGKAVENYLISSLLPGAVFLGPAAGEMAGEIRRVFALGTPLEQQGVFTLQAIETADIPAARVALPAPPMSREALLAETKVRSVEP